MSSRRRSPYASQYAGTTDAGVPQGAFSAMPSRSLVDIAQFPTPSVHYRNAQPPKSDLRQNIRTTTLPHAQLGPMSDASARLVRYVRRTSAQHLTPKTALRESQRNAAKPAFRRIVTTDAHKCNCNLRTLPCLALRCPCHRLGLPALQAGQMAKRPTFVTLCHIKGRTRLSSRFQDAHPSVSMGGKNR